MKKISILGSTGSIGRNTLQIIEKFPDRFCAVALAAGSNLGLLASQIEKFTPKIVSLKNKEDAQALAKLGDFPGTKILYGEQGAIEVACCDEASVVVSAIVGSAGLVPTWRAIEAGKEIALANKETLVTAGALFMKKIVKAGVRLIPVDSEHSAIFQSLQGQQGAALSRIILTASGGPFRGKTSADLEKVTLEMALNHPSWSMGAKITIDSATLMNKGLEVIEARWLFDVPPEQIDVVVHPESIIHSMVEYSDGQVIAQMGVPDMKGPIAYALSYPDRLNQVMRPLDLPALSTLHFYKADKKVFPCLQLAYTALSGPPSMPAALNAANEVAVAAFLKNRIPFTGIWRTIEHVLETLPHGDLSNLEDVLMFDKQARRVAEEFVANI